MSALPLAKPENISNLLNLDQEYAAPAIVADNVIQKDWNAERERSFKDPAQFWGDYATLFEWSQPWSKVLDWDGIHHKWFIGAKTNITINALDRHANSERCNRAAFIWLGEDGTERIVTYGQLYRMVCRFANGLKSLGSSKEIASSSTCHSPSKAPWLCWPARASARFILSSTPDSDTPRSATASLTLKQKS